MISFDIVFGVLRVAVALVAVLVLLRVLGWLLFGLLLGFRNPGETYWTSVLEPMIDAGIIPIEQAEDKLLDIGYVWRGGEIRRARPRDYHYARGQK